VTGRRRTVPVGLVAAAVVMLAAEVRAGNPLVLFAPDRPVVWPGGGRDVPINPDQGSLGSLANAEAVALTMAAVKRWEDVPTSTASFVNAGPLPFDVDETNFAPILFGAPDGFNPVIYDQGGAIISLLYGPFSGVLGFTSFRYRADTGTLIDAAVVLSSELRPGTPLSRRALFGIQVHEFGHYLGLDHSAVNGEIFALQDSSGPTPHDLFVPPTYPGGDTLETMFPFQLGAIVDGEFDDPTGQETPHADDRATVSVLYPEPTFALETGTISGRIKGLDGVAPVGGVNVVARNLGDPFGDAVSAISGGFSGAADPGAYVLKGLTPGAQYMVYIDEISAGGYSTPLARWLPGPEEAFNGTAESDGFGTADPPGEFVPILVQDGMTIEGIDIVFNRLPPGPIPVDLLLNRDVPSGSVELLLPQPFAIGGRTFTTVHLNAFEGTLSFGQPAPGFILSGRSLDHLTGPPRVAGLFTLLDLVAGGTVSFDHTATALTVRYEDVPTLLPDFTAGGPNSFAMTLDTPSRAKSRAILHYGAIDARTGLAGYSAGAGSTSWAEPESDLSRMTGRLVSGRGRTAIYEEFGNLDNDLGGLTLAFEMPGAFTDAFEPNDGRGQARRVRLPFDTARDFTDLPAGDLDFYRFRARAGEVLVAETGLGTVADTVLGLWGPRGELLAVNDDYSPHRTVSRLVVTVPADGEYTLGVATAPDAGFTGAGPGEGRYVLTVRTYRGSILPLDGDDVSVEVPLRFRFPFQGQSWGSVHVSSNGNLTFGAPEPLRDVTDLQLSGFLAGPPRIAPFFSDLDPSGTYNGGLSGFVIADGTAESFTVHWVGVPMILDFLTNTFSVTLRPDGGVEMEWGAAVAEDFDERGVIVGVSRGQGAADPAPTDLSRSREPAASGTTYERFAVYSLWPDRPLFLGGAFDVPSFDLSFSALRFRGDRHDDGHECEE
jgi:hypothetical protein